MRQEIERLQAAMNDLLSGRSGLTVLEAGCGSLLHLVFPDGTFVVGIDIRPDQLQRNKRLDERICGDIQTYDLGTCRSDGIVY